MSNLYESIYTGVEIDNAVSRSIPGGAIDSVLSSKPNPNLLDNWYFGNPVDQRQGRVVKPNTTYFSDNQLTTSAGTTSAYVTAYRYATGTASGVSYASFKLEDTDTAPTYYAAPENVVRGYTGAGYGIDRWKSLNDNLSIIINLDGTITLKNNTASDSWFVQLLDIPERFRGKKLTISVLETAKTGNCYINLYDGTDNLVAVTENGISTLTKIVGASATVLQFVFYIQGNSELTIKAAKLELGTVQTLAHQDENGNWVLNEIPDYGEQLARCQRYFQTFATESLRPTNALDFRPVMRETPALSTITVGGKTLYTASADL